MLVEILVYLKLQRMILKNIYNTDKILFQRNLLLHIHYYLKLTIKHAKDHFLSSECQMGQGERNLNYVFDA